jgi:WD40 repeat protein
VRIWDAASGQQLLTLKGHTGRVTSVAFNPDGRSLASASLDQTVRIWEPVSGKELLLLKGHSRPVGQVAFSPDGRRLASAGWDHMVKIWEAVRLPLEILRQREQRERAFDQVADPLRK